MLEEIFGAQAGLQARLGHRFSHMSIEERIDYINLNVLAATDELHEALNETTWKPWTAGERKIHRDEYVGELVDVFHFIVNLALAVECSPHELWVRYLEKNFRNHARQDAGYTGEKCDKCGGELDRPGIPPIISSSFPGRKFCREECAVAYAFNAGR